MINFICNFLQFRYYWHLETTFIVSLHSSWFVAELKLARDQLSKRHKFVMSTFRRFIEPKCKSTDFMQIGNVDDLIHRFWHSDYCIVRKCILSRVRETGVLNPLKFCGILARKYLGKYFSRLIEFLTVDIVHDPLRNQSKIIELRLRYMRILQENQTCRPWP